MLVENGMFAFLGGNGYWYPGMEGVGKYFYVVSIKVWSWGYIWGFVFNVWDLSFSRKYIVKNVLVKPLLTDPVCTKGRSDNLKSRIVENF